MTTTSLKHLKCSPQNPMWRFMASCVRSLYSSPKRRPLGLDGILDDLDLLRYGRQLVLFEAVELVEAAPSAALVG